MKIKRYIGNNAQEAILKVKMDLGKDALILSTKKVRRKGIKFFFGKPLVEVLAAIDKNIDKGLKVDRKVENKEFLNKINISRNNGDEKVFEFESKVSNMEKMISQIYNKLNNTDVKNRNIKNNEKTSQKVLEVFRNNLIKNDVEEDIVKDIIVNVQNKLGNDINVNNSARLLRQIIVGILGKAKPISIENKTGPKKVIFVGPTGVGKTTTLAKIAANYSLNYKKSVGLITADTYRIAAVEQLKTYAEILGLPVKVIYSANEINTALEEYKDKDIVLIDTAGRSSKNKPQFEELKQLIEISRVDETFLVLSATTSIKNCRDILKNYNFLKVYKLIFTKLDESPISGIILNARYLTNKDLSYVTTGQSVPDDFEVANVDKIAKNLLGST